MAKLSTTDIFGELKVSLNAKVKTINDWLCPTQINLASLDTNGNFNEGRGLVVGYSGGDYPGIGYNVRHTATAKNFIIPNADTASYMLATTQGFNFYSIPTGAAGRTVTLSSNPIRIVNDVVYASAFRGKDNVAGTGEAIHCPAGIYSQGTNYLYGPIITYNNHIDAGTGTFTCGTINASGAVTAPTFSGNLTGNAATSTKLTSTRFNWVNNDVISNVVGQLAWKRNNNGHTIFDASAGTSPDGTAINNTNSTIAWSVTCPTLMGWSGASTYGVRVDSARNADYLSGLLLNTSDRNDVANQIVRTDSNGYIQAGLINTTSGDNGTTAIGRIYASSDGYLRYYTPANFISLLNLIKGDDARLTNARVASDVYAWAKASVKPAYTSSEVGAMPITGGSFTGRFNTTTSVAGNIAASDGNSPFEVTGAGTNGTYDAYMTFHKPGAYAVKFGLGPDNQLEVGGWSLGNVRYKLWTAQNFDPNTKLNTGDVYAWAKAGTKPTYTASEVGALSLTGGTINGDLSVTGNGAFGGSLAVTGDVTFDLSDTRLKTEFEPIETALEKIKKLDVGTYYYNDLAREFGFTKTDRQVGLKAQQVQSVLPEAVALAPFDNDNGVSKSGEEYLTVRYEKLVPLLIEALKAQQKEIELLKEKVGV